MRRAALLAPLLLLALFLLFRDRYAGERAGGDRPRSDDAETVRAEAHRGEAPPGPPAAPESSNGLDGSAAGVTCVVALRDADGPVSGVPVTLSGPGAPVLRATTGDDGIVRFPGRTEERLAVVAELNGDPPRGNWTAAARQWAVDLPLGELHPAAGDTRLDAVLEGRDLTARIRVDGEPGLPDGVRVAQPFARELARSERDGLLEVRLYGTTKGKSKVIVAAPGFIPAAADVFSSQREAEFDLQTAVEVRLLFQGDVPALIGPAWELVRSPVVLRCGPWEIAGRPVWIEEEGAWGQDAVLPPGEWIVEPNVTAGLVAQAAAPFHVFQVPRESGSMLVRVDVGEVVRLVLRVTVPEGYDPVRAQVRAQFGGQTRAWPNDTEIRLPAALPATFRAHHPLLAPDPRRGVAVNPRRDGTVELALVTAPLLRFRAPGYPSEFVPLVLFRPGVFEEPALEAIAVPVEGDTYGFAHAPPGTYDVFFDFRGAVPVLLRGVALGAEGAELGTVPTAPGGSIEVRLLGGPADARAFVRAEALGAPVYVRQAQGMPREAVTLRGLGAGRFRVSCGAKAGFVNETVRSTDEELELDGSSTLVRVVDLR